MIDVLRSAVDAGVTFFDTAEVYGPFVTEELLGDALHTIRDQVVVATNALHLDLDDRRQQLRRNAHHPLAGIQLRRGGDALVAPRGFEPPLPP